MENPLASNAAETARACLRGAEDDSMSFPQIVSALSAAGIESYAIDFRRATATYYLPDGRSIQLDAHRLDTPITPALDTAPIEVAIRQAQDLAPGCSYRRFCRKVAASGCAGYLVSLAGRRAVYFGRDGQTHVEHFPA